MYLVCSHFERPYPAEIDTETILTFCSPLHFFSPLFMQLTINIRERFESQRFWVQTHLEKKFPYSRKAVHCALYYSSKFKSNHFFEELINKQRGTRPWYVNRAIYWSEPAIRAIRINTTTHLRGQRTPYMNQKTIDLAMSISSHRNIYIPAMTTINPTAASW